MVVLRGLLALALVLLGVFLVAAVVVEAPVEAFLVALSFLGAASFLAVSFFGAATFWDDRNESEPDRPFGGRSTTRLTLVVLGLSPFLTSLTGPDGPGRWGQSHK